LKLKINLAHSNLRVKFIPMKHKAILIDAKARTVSEVEVEESVEAYNKLIGSDCYTGGPRLPNRDGLLVDDEGLLKVTDETPFFTFGNYPQPLAGNGLLLGCAANGDTRSVKSTVEAIRGLVKFYSLSEVRKQFA
jgi:hypothetical protein